MNRRLLGVFAALVLLFTVAPLIVLVLSSFDDGKFFRFPPRTWSLRWFQAAFESAEYRGSLWNSAVVATAASLLSVGLGATAALALMRGPLKGRAATEAILLAPLTLPLVIWAIGLLQIYAYLGIGGSVGGLILAHATFTLPLSVRILLASFATINPALEEAALSLGAPPARAFRKVTLPLIAPGLATAAMISFFISFNDVVVSTFIAGSGWITYPVRMYSQLRGQGIDPTTMAIGTMVICAILLLAGLSDLISRRAGRR